MNNYPIVILLRWLSFYLDQDFITMQLITCSAMLKMILDHLECCIKNIIQLTKKVFLIKIEKHLKIDIKLFLIKRMIYIEKQ